MKSFKSFAVLSLLAAIALLFNSCGDRPVPDSVYLRVQNKTGIKIYDCRFEAQGTSTGQQFFGYVNKNKNTYHLPFPGASAECYFMSFDDGEFSYFGNISDCINSLENGYYTVIITLSEPGMNGIVTTETIPDFQ